MSNPLVAQRQDSTTAVSGIGMLESAGDLQKGIESGSWSEIALGGAGMGLEALSMAMDPVGTLVSYAVSWLMEHVKPLSDALDWLAGDPDQISAYAQTWGNVASAVDQVATEFTNEVKNITGSWTGQAADAYRDATTKQAEQIKAAGKAAGSISTVVEIVGVLVGIVRELVRDLVAECVAALITKIPRWIAEIGGTLGIGTPAVIAEAAGMIAKWVSKISDVIMKLTRSLNKLQPLLKKLDEIWQGIKDALKGLRKADGPSTTTPSSADTPSTSPDTSPSPNSDSPSSTSPSSTDASPSSTSPNSHTKEPGVRDGTGDPKDHRTPEQDRNTCGDPIDVASGDVVLPQIDLELPGALPLALRRVHLSSYRVGNHFGTNWSSTLDQLLEVDDQGICFTSDDATVLFYPHPPADGPVMPVEGPRRALRRTEDGGYTINDPAQGHTLHFAPGNAVLPLTAITDRNGNRVDFDRDDAGMPVEIRHSGGYRIRVDTEDGLITALHLRESDNGEDLTLVRYGYQNRRLAEVTNASGLPLRFTYDDAGRITSWTDRNGAWYRYEYDYRGRAVRADGSGGFLSGTMEYDTENRITTWINSLGSRTAYHLDESGRTILEVDPLGGETRSEWDHHDRLLSRTDPLGRTVRYEYDEHGALTGVTRPDGSRILFEYNELRLPTTVVAPDGTISRREYDERGNLARSTDAAGAVTTYAYDEHGRPTSVTDALGNARYVETNPAGLVTAVTDPLGGTTRYERDGFGRITAITDPLGATTRCGWTVDGYPAWRKLPNGSTERWIYDAEGNLRTHIDTLGQRTETEVTHFDLPSVEVRPDGTRLEFGYDTELNLVSVTNEQGLVWRYQYDQAGNMLRETDFNGRVVHYQHNAAGQLVERTNGAGETTFFIRDLLGNVIERRTGSHVATFAYDDSGRLLQAMDNDSQVTFQRDPLGRVLAETINGRTVQSAYDPLGRRIRRRTPSGSESVWEYDANSQPVALHTAGRTLRFGYDAAGHEIERTLGPQAFLSQTWAPDHQLLSQTISTGERRIQQRTYSYRADGFLTGVDDSLSGPRAFDLDRLGRVTAVRGSGWTERYAYDAAGNIANASWPVASASPDAEALGERTYSGTLIRHAGKVRYEHDTQGRIVLRQRKRLSQRPETWRYFWDADDRLTEVLTPDGSRWRYRYDPLGRRIAKQRLTPDGNQVVEQVIFVWDGTVIAEQAHTDHVRNGPDRGEARVMVWNYEPGTFRPLTQTHRTSLRNAPQQWIDDQFYSMITDLVGAPAELINDQGGIAWYHRTTLWGKTLDQSSNIAAYTPLRFPGQYHDPETGFNYNYHRHYDPATGNYASADGLGLQGGLSPHRYVPNPHNWIDPLGLKCGPKRTYSDEEYGKHGNKARSTAKGVSSPAPSNGQAALDRSFNPKPDNPDAFRRYGVDYDNNEIVVLDRHRAIPDSDENIVEELYHGHVPPPSEIPQKVLNQMRREGMIDKKNNVLPPPAE